MTIFLRFNQIPIPVLSIYLQLVESLRKRVAEWKERDREREREYDMLINFAFISYVNISKLVSIL